eukprot:8684409-Pyramimonas_sp.AAC.1
MNWTGPRRAASWRATVDLKNCRNGATLLRRARTALSGRRGPRRPERAEPGVQAAPKSLHKKRYAADRDRGQRSGPRAMRRCRQRHVANTSLKHGRGGRAT